MAKPDDALNFAFAALDRPSWPTTLPFSIDDAISVNAATVEPSAETLRHAAQTGLVAADRFTCRVDATRFTRFLASTKPRTLLLSAIDGEPGVPLLLYWLLEHAALVTRHLPAIASAFDAQIRWALPDDLPARWRTLLKPLGNMSWLSGRYPSGHRRLLPRAIGLSASTNALVLDSVALVDLLIATSTNAAAVDRPVAVGFESDATAFRIVRRGTRVTDLLPREQTPSLDLYDRNEPLPWYAGPRLTDQWVPNDTSIGDGELTFYAEPRGSRFASTCIRCGECLVTCPTRVDVVGLLTSSAQASPSESRARASGLNACIDCGLCTAVCPAGIELHHQFTALRRKLATEAPQ